MNQKLSDAELEIMKIAWAAKGPVLFAYFLEELAAKGKPWQKNTLITLLSRLTKKGYLAVKKIGRRNEYMPLVTETQYQTNQTRNLLDKVYEGNVRCLVSNLISGDLLTAEEYEELMQLLEEEKDE